MPKGQKNDMKGRTRKKEPFGENSDPDENNSAPLKPKNNEMYSKLNFF